MFPALIHIHLNPGDSFFMNLSRFTSIYLHLLNLNSTLKKKKKKTLLCVSSLSILHSYPEHSTRLPMPNGCPTIQLHSDTVNLEIVSDPTGEGAQSYKTGFLSHSRHQSQVPVVTSASDWLAMNWTHNSFLGSN